VRSIGARVSLSEERDETVDGFHIHIGGGYGVDAGIGREIYRDVKADDAPKTIERMLKSYLANREGDETFLSFTRRQEIETLKTLFDAEAVE
jgi:ferredoxin-nitrite reductase